MKNKKQLGIYIHIPFCVRKCDYCDFLSGPANDAVKTAYVRALKREIAHTAGILRDRGYQPEVYGVESCRAEVQRTGACQAEDYQHKIYPLEDYQVETIFFGGGTPTTVNAEFIAQLLDEVRKNFSVASSAEITIECNPGTLTKEKAYIYRNAGVNRISFGLQSADNKLLKLIGRIHTWNDFNNSFELARDAGFENINVDIMSALPGQTLAGYVQGLEKVIRYEPEHISAYSLILEEGTPLGDNPSKYPPVPDEDTEREMYYETLRLLEAYGYHRYEISNYAKRGCECRHNLSYWERKDYLGFGVGAASLFEGKRMSNIRSINEYISLMRDYGEYISLMGEGRSELRAQSQLKDISGDVRLMKDYVENVESISAGGKCRGGKPNDMRCMELEERLHSEVEILSREDAMSEFMFLGLRKTAGVKFADFARQFGVDIGSVFGVAIEENVAKGLLEYVVDGGAAAMESQSISITETTAEVVPSGCRLTRRGTDVSNVVLADFLL